MNRDAKMLIVAHPAGHPEAGLSIAAFMRELAGLGDLLIVVVGLENYGEIESVLGVAEPAKDVTGISLDTSLSSQMIRSYLAAGCDKVGLIKADSEDDIKFVFSRLSGLYDYIVFYSGASGMEGVLNRFRSIGIDTEKIDVVFCPHTSDIKKEVLERLKDSKEIKVPIEEGAGAAGLGPLDVYLKDPEITEIMVNSTTEIYIERAGRIERVCGGFESVERLMVVVERIVAPIGRRIDESSPVVDARLSDGSRVHIIIPPLSLKGPTITIRKFRRDLFAACDLVSSGSISSEMALFLEACVESKANILVSGGTGSGKTTILNIISSFVPAGERIITIEDSAELRLAQPHVVRLESRPPNIEGRGEVTIRDLVKASLRMRPDRIIVGEVRGLEALDMLQAMNTGHEGSLTTIHANSYRDSLARLETLVMFAGFDLPSKVVREQIASAIDIIVQVKRFKDGRRRVVDISEITGLEGQTITTQELFVYRDGRHAPTGFRPRFLDTGC